MCIFGSDYPGGKGGKGRGELEQNLEEIKKWHIKRDKAEADVIVLRRALVEIKHALLSPPVLHGEQDHQEWLRHQIELAFDKALKGVEK